MIGNSNDEYNFTHKLLLINTEVSSFVRILKMVPQLLQNHQKLNCNKKGQSGQFLGRFLGPLLKPGLPLMKNVLKKLVKNVLIQLG